jgi:hypothetical protein
MTQPAPEQRFTTARQALESLKSGQIVSQSVRKNGVVSQRTEPINNSGCGINNTKEQVPDEILGWNWGAFLMPWFWLWTNQVWVGLLCFFPSIGWVMTIILGVNGNEWAWKSRRWRSVQHFKEHQRGWAIAGMLIGAPFSIILWMAAIAFLTSFL